MSKVNGVTSVSNYKGMDVLRVKASPDKPGAVIAVMDEDTFERCTLPKDSSLYDLEDAPGSMNGRPIINKIVENQDQIKETWKDIKESVDDDDGSLRETIFGIIKGLFGLDD